MIDYNSMKKDFVEVLEKYNADLIEMLTLLSGMTGDVLMSIQKFDADNAKRMLHEAFDRAVEMAIDDYAHEINSIKE